MAAPAPKRFLGLRRPDALTLDLWTSASFKRLGTLHNSTKDRASGGGFRLQAELFLRTGAIAPCVTQNGVGPAGLSYGLPESLRPARCGEEGRQSQQTCLQANFT